MSEAPLPNPFPDHRDLYLIVAGIIVGLLCSSAILGRVAPNWYDSLFVGSGAAVAQVQQASHHYQQLQGRLKQLQRTQAVRLEELKSTGVTAAAVQETASRFQGRLDKATALLNKAQGPLILAKAHLTDNRQKYARWLGERMTALILVMFVIMVFESLIAPEPRGHRTAVVPPALGRLVTIRYALAAIWIGMAVARPSLLLQTPIVFAALLLLVALAVSFVPLGPRPRNPRPRKLHSGTPEASQEVASSAESDPPA